MPYLNVTEVESAIQALSVAYPGQCELITLPNVTIEGRTSHALRIGNGPLDDRPGLLFIGGQHAREWGSPEICINFAADVLEAYDTNSGLSYGGTSYTAAQIQALVNGTQVFLFPCVNPDGRNHSQTSFAMWRKNRRDNGDGTMGVDLNRNYDVLWDFNTAFSPLSSVSVSNDTSSDVYHGTAPFSEPETRNVKWLLDTYPQIGWFIDIHSYSQLLYTNWGDDENQITTPSQNFLNATHDGDRGIPSDGYSEYIRPGDLAAQNCLAQTMQSALQGVRGITYQTGQSFNLYPTSGTATDYPYSRHFADNTKTKTHGFLIEWGTTFQPTWSEMEEIILDVSAALVAFARAAPCTCGEVDAVLSTPQIVFNDVPEGQTTFRAAVFEVESCQDVTFEIIDGPNVNSGPPATSFGTPLGTSDSTTGSPSGTEDAQIWISYTGTGVGDMASGDVTVRCNETGQEWVIPITANSIAAPSAVVALVLDRSGSMTNPSGIGPGIARADVLEFSAPTFVDVIDEGNAIAVVQFDENAQVTLPVKQITNLGDRLSVSGHVSGYMPNPLGRTSIGGGVSAAHGEIDPETDYDLEAIVVFTDGKENEAPYIADVAPLIDERVYAIGLGTADNLQPSALQALCDGHEGYLLMTGDLDASATFRLAKYYQQILAGVTNQDVVLDPEGAVRPGHPQRIPFRLTEADYRAEVVLLTPAPQAIRFALEAPDGTVYDPGSAAASSAIDFGMGRAVAYYRISLPLPSDSGKSHGGTWHALLDGDSKYYDRYVHGRDDVTHASSAASSALAHGIPYSLTARASSNLRLRARLAQSSREPGAILTLRAVLTEYGIPIDNRANVRAEMERPSGGTTILHLSEDEPGLFVDEVIADEAGVYRFRVLARGRTLRGVTFTREQLLTGAVWSGGDRPPPTSDDRPETDRDVLCRLLVCLLRSDGFRRFAKEHGIDTDHVMRCLKGACQERRPAGGKEPTPQRQTPSLDAQTTLAVRTLASQLPLYEAHASE